MAKLSLLFYQICTVFLHCNFSNFFLLTWIIILFCLHDEFVSFLLSFLSIYRAIIFVAQISPCILEVLLLWADLAQFGVRCVRSVVAFYLRFCNHFSFFGTSVSRLSILYFATFSLHTFSYSTICLCSLQFILICTQLYLWRSHWTQ